MYPITNNYYDTGTYTPKSRESAEVGYVLAALASAAGTTGLSVFAASKIMDKFTRPES